MDQAKVLLALAYDAVEGLHGESEVRLRARHVLDDNKHTIVVDGSSDVGRDVARVLTSFMTRELGAEAFTVEAIVGESRQRAVHGGPATTN